MQTFVTLFGAALQVLGVVVAAVGLRRTWQQHAPDEPLLQPLIGQAQAA